MTVAICGGCAVTAPYYTILLHLWGLTEVQALQFYLNLTFHCLSLSLVLPFPIISSNPQTHKDLHRKDMEGGIKRSQCRHRDIRMSVSDDVGDRTT